MQPCKVSVRALELAKLGLLTEPENAERYEAEQPGQEPWRRCRQRVEEFGLGVDVGWFGRVKIEHQDGRRDGEKTVAQRRDTTDFAAGYHIVMGLHGATIASQVNRVNPRATSLGVVERFTTEPV